MLTSADSVTPPVSPIPPQEVLATPPLAVLPLLSGEKPAESGLRVRVDAGIGICVGIGIELRSPLGADANDDDEDNDDDVDDLLLGAQTLPLTMPGDCQSSSALGGSAAVTLLLLLLLLLVLVLVLVLVVVALVPVELLWMAQG